MIQNGLYHFSPFIFALFVTCFGISCSSETYTNCHLNVDAHLSAILKTNRISSNHFCETVVDSTGSVYIATFLKKQDNHDYIQILKLDQCGNIIWTRGHNYKGRATALTITPKETIVITGWTTDKLKFGEFEINQKGEEKVFLAEFDSRGECINLSAHNSNGIFNVESDQDGQILISGKSSGEAHSNSNHDKGDCQRFISLVNQNLEIIWTQCIDIQIVRTKFHRDYFYLTGKFSDSAIFTDTILTTTDPLDEDGFIMKLDKNGKQQWVRQFGVPRPVNYYTRSNESGGDITIKKNGNILVSSLQNTEEDEELYSLVIIEYDPHGNKINSTLLSNEANNTITTINTDQQQDIWITWNRKYNPQNSEGTIHSSLTYIQQYDSSFEMKYESAILHGPNTIIRSSDCTSKRIIYTGHFQDVLNIDGQSISNNGEHEIFLYSINTTEQKATH